jgi:histidyl-tRNA synthetase
VTSEFLGAQNAVVGGGRYDHLIRDLGGPDISGIGFAVGFERLAAMISEGDANAVVSGPVLFIAALGETALEKAFLLCNRLRMKGIRVEMDHAGRSLKSQMKRADKLKSTHTLILGEREIAENKALLRNMLSSTQTEVDLDSLKETITELAR